MNMTRGILKQQGESETTTRLNSLKYNNWTIRWGQKTGQLASRTRTKNWTIGQWRKTGQSDNREPRLWRTLSIYHLVRTISDTKQTMQASDHYNSQPLRCSQLWAQSSKENSQVQRQDKDKAMDRTWWHVVRQTFLQLKETGQRHFVRKQYTIPECAQRKYAADHRNIMWFPVLRPPLWLIDNFSLCTLHIGYPFDVLRDMEPCHLIKHHQR